MRAAACLAFVLAACASDPGQRDAQDACPNLAATPTNATLSRIPAAHASDDPTTVRLCQEGATPPDQLENPWDLHCEVASGPSAAIDENAPAPSRLRVVEWNIKFGTELTRVGDLLATHPILSLADVLLLVEVDRGCNRSGKVDVSRELGARLGMEWVFGVEFIEHSQGGCEEGNAILSRHALFNPVHRFHNVGKIERGGLHSPYDWALDADEPRTGRRSFLGADLRFGKGLLHVVSAHLENRSNAEERGGQISEIVQLLGELPRKAACVAGDFNVFPNIGEAVIDQSLFDSLSGACFVNPHADMPDAERRTRPSLNYQIDFTYLRAVQIIERGVVNDLPDVPSDHYPVWVDIAPR